ncbi:MAG: hypothetical protein ABIQ02_02650 [Saprospiraceae bacterium]
MKPKKSETKSEEERSQRSHSTKPSTNYKVFPTKTFLLEAKKLLKKYPGIKKDFLNLKDIIKKTPRTGDDMGDGFYKIRMDITDKDKGKSGSARVIIKVIEEDGLVVVMRTYDKSDLDKVIIQNLKKQARKEGL